MKIGSVSQGEHNYKGSWFTKSVQWWLQLSTVTSSPRSKSYLTDAKCMHMHTGCSKLIKYEQHQDVRQLHIT